MGLFVMIIDVWKSSTLVPNSSVLDGGRAFESSAITKFLVLLDFGKFLFPWNMFLFSKINCSH